MLFDRIRYFLGILIMIPVFPIMYWQSKKLLRDFPDLPEAQEPYGSTGTGNRLSVLLLGESSVAGVGVTYHQHGLAGQMAAQLARLTGTRVDWQVVAKSGYTARKVYDKLIDKIPQEHFDLIVIGLGGNDTFQLSTPWSWRKQMKALVLALHEKHPESAIVVTCMPPVHTFPAFSGLLKFFLGHLTRLHGREIKRLAKRIGYLYYYDYVISIAEWIEKNQEAHSPADFYSDGVHPSALTYRIWGRDTARYIHESGVTRPKTG